MMMSLLPGHTTQAWQWTDWVTSTTTRITTAAGTHTVSSQWLTLEEVSDMRVRDIKRRLARTHGYAADELATMILKKELVETLAFEEEKVRLRYVEEVQRTLFQQGVVVAVVAVGLVMCWPLIQQGLEIAHVNWVVYTDRKRLEFQKCLDYHTLWGLLGVLFMLLLDVLQAWLTLSVLLSWFVKRSPYFFPTPNVPIRPAQFMGNAAMDKAMGGFAVNVGPMIVTYGLRFLHGQLESWTAKCLQAALRRQKKQRKQQSTSTTTNSDEASQPSRRQARRRAQQAAATAAAAAASTSTRAVSPVPPPDLPPNWMEPRTAPVNRIPTSREHDEFLENLQSTTAKEEEEIEEAGRVASVLEELD
jgi:hypothetical protein